MKVTVKYSAPADAPVTVTITATLGELKRLAAEKLVDKQEVGGYNSLASNIRSAILSAAVQLESQSTTEVAV
jgi:hypothetical protein